ncbi:zinc-binding protein A33-like [Erythrolamprus reginae]|uniref:zinc-binding protein A33-like n=1 Tax=Erythrolamprus reginae TaxID=121349 RepID=UPI00396CFC12
METDVHLHLEGAEEEIKYNWEGQGSFLEKHERAIKQILHFSDLGKVCLSSRAAPTGIECFAEDLRCSICLELFSDPVILECGHNYCQVCITRFWAEIPNNHEENLPPTLPTCPECRREIPGGKYTPNWVLGQLACKAQESLLVQVGDEVANGDADDEEVQGDKLFCTGDGCLVRALQPDHWGHQCLPLVEAVEHFKLSFSTYAAELWKPLEPGEGEKQAYWAHQKLGNGFLSSRRPLGRYCPGEDKASPLPVISRDFNLGQFKGPIQYMVWREMLLALRPFPAPITLDPATNHPNLVLSKDLDTVLLEDNPKEVVLDGPERFSKTVCVLGAQGFTSGCHYWEVEVGNKTSWDIGVAKESVNRKEAKVTVKPSNGFWAIWLRNGNEYKALDSPSRQLLLNVKAQKIGVYLDYEGGQVSFYDADTMTHIHTFLDVFSECLYPMFSPGVNKDGLNGEPLCLLCPRI